jgi:hypothetical protein
MLTLRISSRVREISNAKLGRTQACNRSQERVRLGWTDDEGVIQRSATGGASDENAGAQSTARHATRRAVRR